MIVGDLLAGSIIVRTNDSMGLEVKVMVWGCNTIGL